MNNIPILGDRKLSEDQVACVDILKEALALALEGKVHGIAMVACMDGGWATLFGGSRPGDLNLGTDDLKRKILDAVLNAPKTKATSRIVRGRMG